MINEQIMIKTKSIEGGHDLRLQHAHAKPMAEAAVN